MGCTPCGVQSSLRFEPCCLEQLRLARVRSRPCGPKSDLPVGAAQARAAKGRAARASARPQAPGAVRRNCAKDDPASARPKGNTSRWVTTDDYRSRWILKEMAGTARFNLTIDTRGTVTGCTVTCSTGHAPLGAATCEMVTRRARPEAAHGGTRQAGGG